jgi:hypothetical protein
MNPEGGALLRGANWNNGTNAGLFTVNLNNAPSNSNTNIAFRCVFRPARLDNKISWWKFMVTAVGHD